MEYRREESNPPKLSEARALECQHWLDDRLKACIEAMVHEVRRYVAECPAGLLTPMTEAEEIRLEGALHDIVTDSVDMEEVYETLEYSGYASDIWDSRATLIDRAERAKKEQSLRPVPTNPETVAFSTGGGAMVRQFGGDNE